MPKYVSMVTVEDREFQNVQELASIWGEIRRELEEFEVDVIDTYAVLGSYDFLLIFDAPDRDTVFQAAITIEGYGMDLQTMEITHTDRFADLVDDRA
ncbi:gyd domain protein [Halobacteriales archaeon QS_1_68_20]|nr:MAG: gyd domain protein [Halobacteriales archaeon QS_1_68_20]